MEVLGEFNGLNWFLTEAPTGEYGTAGPLPDLQPPPPHWREFGESVTGYVRLVAPDRIEFSLADGELIAVYEPEDRPFPGCD